MSDRINTPTVAVWRKGETEAEFVTRAGHLPVSLKRFHSEIATLCEAIEELQAFGQAMNARNVERNEKIATLERRCAELESERSLDRERIKTLEDRPLGVRYTGVWEPTRTYERDEAVTWGGGIWVCLVDRCVSRRPGDPLSRERVWQLAVQRGKAGKDGRDGKDAE